LKQEKICFFGSFRYLKKASHPVLEAINNNIFIDFFSIHYLHAASDHLHINVLLALVLYLTFDHAGTHCTKRIILGSDFSATRTRLVVFW